MAGGGAGARGARRRPAPERDRRSASRPTSPGSRPGLTCIRTPYERMSPMDAAQVRPDRSTFDRRAAEWPLVPVWAELLADVGTPVGLFPAIAGDGPGILLESVERSERWGRYSFLAGDPAAVVVVDDDGLHLRDVVRDLPIGEPSRRLSPREALRAAAGKLQAPRLEGLPPITGGLMGCATYEAATLLDGHPAPHAAEAT